MAWQIRDLVTVLMLTMGMLGGYLVWQDFRHLFTIHTTAVENLVGRQEQNVRLFTEIMGRFERHSAEQNESWRRLIGEQNREWQRLLWIHDHNQGKAPEDRLPLIIAPEATPEGTPGPPRAPRR